MGAPGDAVAREVEDEAIDGSVGQQPTLEGPRAPATVDGHLGLQSIDEERPGDQQLGGAAVGPGRQLDIHHQRLLPGDPVGLSLWSGVGRVREVDLQTQPRLVRLDGQERGGSGGGLDEPAAAQQGNDQGSQS